jgi:hypothetical protein
MAELRLRLAEVETRVSRRESAANAAAVGLARLTSAEVPFAGAGPLWPVDVAWGFAASAPGGSTREQAPWAHLEKTIIRRRR